MRRLQLLGVPVLLAAVGCGSDEPAYKELSDAERQEQMEKAKAHQSQHNRDGSGSTTVQGQQTKAYKDAVSGGGGSGGGRRGSGAGNAGS